MKIIVTHELQCPKCKSFELRSKDNPVQPGMLNIRGYKVDLWSHCLVCAGYYNVPKDFDWSKVTYENPPPNYNPDKGWFK